MLIPTSGGGVNPAGDTMTGGLVISTNAAALPAPSASQTLLQLGSADAAACRLSLDAFANGCTIEGRRATGTAAAPGAVGANQFLLNLVGSGRGTSAYFASAAQVRFLAAEAWTDTAQGSYFQIWSTATGTLSSAARVVAIITSEGGMVLGPGLTSADNNPGTTLRLKPVSTQIGQVITLAAAQTAHALDINSNGGGGGDLLYVDAAGALRVGGNVGFYGVAPTARQLLATGAGHTVDDVISALQTLGLLRQS